MKSELKRLANPKMIRFLKGRGVVELSPGSMRLTKVSQGLWSSGIRSAAEHGKWKPGMPHETHAKSLAESMATAQHPDRTPVKKMDPGKLMASIRARGATPSKMTAPRRPRFQIPESLKRRGAGAAAAIRKHGPGLARAGLIGGGLAAGGAALGLSTILSRHAEQQMTGGQRFYRE
jgi:hypothetical protein